MIETTGRKLVTSDDPESNLALVTPPGALALGLWAMAAIFEGLGLRGCCSIFSLYRFL